MDSKGLAAAILVGGQSRRMGTDKAMLTLDPDGPTVVESIARKLRKITDEVFLVGAAPADYASLGLTRLPDIFPGAGALGGIHSALAASTKPHVLIVGCDLPFLSVNLLRYMASLPRDYDILVPLLEQLQPLHAIYARTCLPVVEQQLQAGQFKVSGWFEQVTVRKIDRADISMYDPMLLSTFNMNTPEHLAFAKQVVAGDVPMKMRVDSKSIS